MAEVLLPESGEVLGEGGSNSDQKTYLLASGFRQPNI